MFIGSLDRLIVALFLALLLALSVQQSDATGNFQVVGLFKDQAVIVTKGKQRILRAGEKPIDGIKLISSTSREALLEIDGKRTRLGLGNHIGSRYAARTEPPAVRIWSNANGMFTTIGSINGYPVKFLVDTGATMLAMNGSQARRLGLDFEFEGEPQWVTTASGVEKAYRVTLDRVKVGDIELTNVDSAVLGGDFPPQVLLGMSFLNRLEMQRDGTMLELRKKY
jgi:aspartyl protease family protein